MALLKGCKSFDSIEWTEVKMTESHIDALTVLRFHTGNSVMNCLAQRPCEGDAGNHNYLPEDSLTRTVIGPHVLLSVSHNDEQRACHCGCRRQPGAKGLGDF